MLDYRPALRQRTGVGEFVHELARALSAESQRVGGDELALLTISWKDRPAPSLRDELPGVQIIDRRLPVRPLTWAWNRLGWPPVEWLAGPADVIHAQAPLLIPASHGAGVITIHDLDFLHHPDRVTAEMRRDFPRLVHQHASRADHIVVSSQYAAGEVVRTLSVTRDRVTVCSPGTPAWANDVAQQRATAPPGRHVLFVGTLEPRKNVGVLLDAFAHVRAHQPSIGSLVLAGRATPAAQPWIDRAARADLAGHVQILGYISDARKRELYRDARMLVLPSLEEGFGLPVLEAMASGVPVVVSRRGSLPEVAGAAASPVEPEDVDAIAAEMERLLDRDTARLAVSQGLAQAARYTWANCARSALDAYRAAISLHASRLA